MRFSTVLGNGADAFHDTHVHIDLMERSNHYKICQWAVLDAAQTVALAAKKAAALTTSVPLLMIEPNVPIPRPRPVVHTDAGNSLQHSVPQIPQEGRMPYAMAEAPKGTARESTTGVP